MWACGTRGYADAMRILIAVAAALATITPAVAVAAPVEGYKSPNGKVACVYLRGYDANGSAVRCGKKGSSRGRLLTNKGAAKSVAWSWPAKQLGSSFFTAPTGKYLYLVGGTAKLTGDSKTLRCKFTTSSVRCLNGAQKSLSVKS